MKKYIFVDLDNTLIAAEPMYNSPPRDAKTIKLGKYESYWARVRPGALDLLSKLRQIGPTFILTAATNDYACGWNEQFKLGFDTKDIFSREDTAGVAVGERLKRPSGNCYLIDDLPETASNTFTKIKFISDIGPVKYINIKPYTGYDNQALNDNSILTIISQIV
jgi:hypothetical protein